MPRLIFVASAVYMILGFAVLQVSPDGNFKEIVGVSDTFVPAANVWVGEYPYLEKASGTCATRLGDIFL